MTDYEKLNLVIGFLALIASYGGLALLYYGIRQMDRGSARRAAESKRQHEETMTALAEEREEARSRHEEAMKALAEEREASQRRHDEAMRKHDEAMRKHDEAMRKHDEAAEESKRRHEESMAALTELIKRTGNPHHPEQRAVARTPPPAFSLNFLPRLGIIPARCSDNPIGMKPTL